MWWPLPLPSQGFLCPLVAQALHTALSWTIFFVALRVPWFREKEESRCACWKVPAQRVGSNRALLAASHLTPQWRGVQVSGQ